MKTCTKCQRTEEQVKFSIRVYKSGTIGKQMYCQECNREYKKQHYFANKESYISKNRKRIKDNYQKLYSFLSDKACKECGNKDPRVFEFNHLDPKMKKADIASMIRSCCWDSVLLEIQKCEILCANCHRIKTLYQMGSAKYKLNID